MWGGIYYFIYKSSFKILNKCPLTLVSVPTETPNKDFSEKDRILITKESNIQ